MHTEKRLEESLIILPVNWIKWGKRKEHQNNFKVTEIFHLQFF